MFTHAGTQGLQLGSVHGAPKGILITEAPHTRR